MKAAIHNLGCKTNAYEAEAMEQALKEAGYEIVDFNGDEPADIYVINTCSVTNIADRKSRQMIHKAKGKNSDAVVVAVGCFVQAKAEEILKNEPVDICLGSNDKHLLASSIEEFKLNAKKIKRVSDISKDTKYERLEVSHKPRRTRAFIKIQDGCNRFCSYCIIPYVRGRIRSRGIEDIVNEVISLSKAGVKEVVLTGINLSSYGDEFNDGTDISDVAIALNGIEEIERIRISSFEPQLITEDFLKKIRNVSKLCPHFHLSMQSGSDSVLNRMRRGYSTKEYLDKCSLLRKYYDNPSITTDIITAFPGETEEEFRETYDFLEEIGFFDIHVFSFSPRKGTPAADMPNPVDGRTAKLRSALLISKGQELTRRALKDRVGAIVEILAEEYVSKDGEIFLTGHTTDYVKVFVRMKEKSDELIGQIVNVRLIELMQKDSGIRGIVFEKE